MRARERPAEEGHGGGARGKAAGRRIGELVAGRYLVEERLGAGGMGSVYKVTDQSTQRVCALKELGGRSRPSRADRDDDEPIDGQTLRFRREFHTMARLKHPRVVEVYEFGLDGGNPFYTLELLDGQDLRDVGQLPVGRACEVLRDVASALAYLHARRLVHRDVAPRNVRCTRGGRAKLIDFGVIATPGIVGDIAGTPRFISPENIRGLPLDHRADLYSLGALAFWVLTGKDAYGAQHVDELEEAWKKRPVPPSQIASDVPHALDDLVLSMLSLDPLARPANAAEVIDRLGAIAGLEPLGETDAARSYLASAALVGRRREMDVLKRRIQRVVEGEGGAISIEAPSGTGKSRLLREAALEAQIAGLTIASATGDDAGRGPYGLVAALARSLVAASPKASIDALRPHAPVLSRILPDLGARVGPVILARPLGDPSEERGRVQSELVAWLLEVARQAPLMLLVDDVQRSDEASAAVLAAVAHAARAHPIVLAIGHRTDEPTRAVAAVAAIRDAASRVRLGSLKPKDVEELVHGMFGDVPNLPKVAAWVQRIAGSSPLHCIELLRHLVDEDVIRFKDGLWTVPEEPPGGVPQGLAEAMRARVRALDPTARALGEVLSVHGGELPLRLCVSLAEGMNEKDVFSAIDELSFQEVLVGSGAVYRFRHDGLREALLASLDPARKTRLHLAVGRALEEGKNAVDGREAEIGWHLLEGGERTRGADLLARAGTRLYEAQSFHDAVRPLEAALGVYEAEARPLREVLELRHMLILVGAMSDRDVTLRYGPGTIEVLRRSAGIARAARLRRVLPPLLAVLLGLGLAWVAWLLTRPSRRGPTPMAAMQRFYVEVAYTTVAYSLSFDERGVRDMLSLLEPLTVFANSMPSGAYFLTDGMLGMPLGSWGRVRRDAREVFRILEADRITPLTEFDRKNAHGAARYMLATVACLSQDPSCLQEIAELRALEMRYFDVCARIAQMTYHRLRGEEEQAMIVQREIELMLVSLGSMWGPESTIHWISGLAYGLTRDVLGLRRTIEQVNRLVRDGYALEHFLELARGEYLRERGELEASQKALERALGHIEEEECFTRPAILSAMAETKLAARDLPGAREWATKVILLERERPDCKENTWRLRAERVLAMVEAAEGDASGAARRLDGAIDEAKALGSPSLCGMLHEARTRVAVAANEPGEAALHRRAAESWYRGTKNPALIARIGRLPEPSHVATDAAVAEDAQTRPESTAVATPSARGGVAAASELSVLTDEPVTVAEGSEASWVSGILRNCRGPAERAERALDLLVVASGGTGGYLYLAREGTLQLAAPLHGDEPPDALSTALHRTVRMLVEQGKSGAPPPSSGGLADGDEYGRVLLVIDKKGHRAIVGIAAIQGGSTPPSPRFAHQVARELHDAGDVSIGSFSA